MNYIVHFSSGNTLVIDEARYTILNDYGNDKLPANLILKVWINVNNIDYIIPEPQASTGVSHTPKPQDILDRKKQKTDAVKADSQEVLDRTKNKYESEA